MTLSSMSAGSRGIGVLESGRIAKLMNMASARQLMPVT